MQATVGDVALKAFYDVYVKERVNEILNGTKVVIKNSAIKGHTVIR
jgi:hypothetical protein